MFKTSLRYCWHQQTLCYCACFIKWLLSRKNSWNTKHACNLFFQIHLRTIAMLRIRARVVVIYWFNLGFLIVKVNIYYFFQELLLMSCTFVYFDIHSYWASELARLFSVDIPNEMNVWPVFCTVPWNKHVECQVYWSTIMVQPIPLFGLNLFNNFLFYQPVQ